MLVFTAILFASVFMLPTYFEHKIIFYAECETFDKFTQYQFEGDILASSSVYRFFADTVTPIVKVE